MFRLEAVTIATMAALSIGIATANAQTVANGESILREMRMATRGEVLFVQDTQGVLAPENANEARLNRLQPPDQVMDAIGIRPGMVGAEIGAGHGRYVVQLAVRVGESGKIYAEDIDADALRYLEGRCERWGLTNVETIVGEITDPRLPEGELDFIFVISAYHHFADPTALLRNARASLKPDGMLAIGEWLRSTSPEELEAEMNAAGYRLERTETFLEANGLYIYVFRIG
ncbi:MAG: class I SAM-dependent methyltransferase [Gemmatimonadota bacterium]|nr:MAG: class I SAM-dependent methyltransferase [Gemmatimonadota bacterium]